MIKVISVDKKQPAMCSSKKRSCRVGGTVRPKSVKKHMKLNCNFQRGGRGGGKGSFKKIPSVWEVKIFSGTAQYLL